MSRVSDRIVHASRLILTNVDGLDSDTLFNVSGLGVVGNFVGQHLGFTEGVNEGGATGTRGAYASKMNKKWRDARFEDAHRRP